MKIHCTRCEVFSIPNGEYAPRTHITEGFGKAHYGARDCQEQDKSRNTSSSNMIGKRLETVFNAMDGVELHTQRIEVPPK